MNFELFPVFPLHAGNSQCEIMLASPGRASLNCIRGALVLLLVFASSTFASAQNAPAESPGRFTFAPKPGPYPVGFRVVFQYDSSRTYQEAVDLLGKPNTAELARPVQTLIWYPAQKSDNPPIVFGDYLALSVKELEPTAAKGSIEALDQLKKTYGDVVTEKTWAVKDASPAPGPYCTFSGCGIHLRRPRRCVCQERAEGFGNCELREIARNQAR